MGGLAHHPRINPTENQLQGLIDEGLRGNDAPLFWGHGKDSLGMEVKTVYNKCMSLLYYRPDSMDGQDAIFRKLDALEEKTIKCIKFVKKLKEDYSDTWKQNFEKYKHHEVEDGVAVGDGKFKKYNDKDPFDMSWMNHPLLTASKEMQEAAAKYMQDVEVALLQFQYILDAIVDILTPFMLTEGLDSDQWAEAGEGAIDEKLKAIQKQVDIILVVQWNTHVKTAMDALGTSFKALPSYIGSTHSGKKSVTKAFVQFNPKDYDVDGQLVSTQLYNVLATLGLSASKQRYFVRVVVDEAITKVGEVTDPTFGDETFKNNLIAYFRALKKYVDETEKVLVKEMEGVIADPDDPFDLAIVQS